MAEVTSGDLTVVVLDRGEAEALVQLLHWAVADGAAPEESWRDDLRELTSAMGG